MMYIFDEFIEDECLLHKARKLLTNMYNPYGVLVGHFHYVDTDNVRMIYRPLKINRKIKKMVKKYVKNYKRRLKRNANK